MHAFRRFWILAAAVGASLAVVAPAPAQINPFRGFGPNMSEDDLQRMTAATAAMNGREKPVVGGIEAWRNADNSGGGTATLTRVYTWNGMPCHTIAYKLLIADRTESRRRDLVLDWCRIASGEWRIRS